MKGGACSGSSFQSASSGSQATAEQAMHNTSQQIKCTYASATGSAGGGKRKRRIKKKSRRKVRKSRKSRKVRKSKKRRYRK
tara:strand:+ start:1831 stop:2073 length:243 start_codon:yes stop_codon:yes gene_type:complete